MRDIPLPALRCAIIVCLAIAALLIGYFSLYLNVGGADIMDPRDIIVVCAGVLTGPAGGAIVGLLAGFPGSDPFVEIPMYMVSGIAVGVLSRYCIAHRVWIPYAALGLGCGYILQGILLMYTSWYGEIATLAFRSLIMLTICILLLYIIDSLDRRIFSWQRVRDAELPLFGERREELPPG